MKVQRDIMRINFPQTQINFQKKFITTGTVLKRGRAYDCNIYELDPTEDKDYFTKIKRDKKWEKARYIDDIIKDFNMDYEDEKFYTIENKKDKCIGFVKIANDEEDNTINIDLIETCPKYASRTKGREYKRIGSALINFLVELAKKNKAKALTVLAIAEAAKGFYPKVGFDVVYETYIDALIPSEKYDDVLIKNDVRSKKQKKH